MATGGGNIQAVFDIDNTNLVNFFGFITSPKIELLDSKEGTSWKVK